MKTKNLKLKTQNCGGGILIIAVMIFCVLSGMAWSIENPSVGNPIGSSTLPPSSIRSGLIRSPNPIDSSGNLVITGNVGGGSYFHGPVPYRSTTSFAAPLGSAYLDSFLRDSASSDDFDRYIGGYGVQPYYSLTGTVTTTTPGRSGVFAPSTTRIAERAPDTFGVENVPKKGISPEQSTSISGMRLLPTSLSPQQIKLGSEEITTADKNIRGERLTSEQYKEQMEQLRRDLERIKARTEELRQRLGEKDESLQISTKVEPSESVRLPPNLASQEARGEKSGVVEAQTPAPQKQTKETLLLEPTGPVQEEEQLDTVTGAGKERVWSPETYERIKKHLDNLQTTQAKEKTSGVTEKGSEPTYSVSDRDVKATLTKSTFGGSATLGRYKESAAGEEQPSQENPSLEVFLEGQSGAEDVNSMPGTMELEETSGKSKKTSAPEEAAKLSSAQLSSEARRIMGPHKDIKSFSEARFNQYMQAAQTYLKQGKYYRAADSYALASIYKKDDAGAYAGRGHALFAAGEYMSSALFISRAIELSAAYAQGKNDLVTLLGDRDKLEGRIADVKEWLKRSDAGELQFLLGYVYYQIGKLNEAKQAIDIAYEKKPQWPAVQVIKKAIDDAIGSSKTK
jgi:tetratricopeptide (TPR) repeat protein